MRRKRLALRIVLTLIAAVFALGFLMPTVLTFTNSLMSETELTAHYGAVFTSLSKPTAYMAEGAHLRIIPDKVSFSQYVTVLFKSPEYLLKFWNSVILVVPIVILQVGVAAMAAYSFFRYCGKLRSVLFFFYVILMLMPYQVTLVPNRLVAGWLHIINTRAAIVLPGVFAPFSVFLLTKFMRRIPPALIEAAKLDGASEWRIFTRVCLPQCRSALYSIAILVFIDYW
ncbi:MAG: carbohydrate ABC transporter permease, partial [Oscillospiraceae bacterium]|nr:carbohydrate ABC transporter permease [Oscillospiraceae bacterium]